MIAILTPYGRNEVTAAAVRVADLATSAGHEVRLVACGVKESGVHAAWDARVRSAQGTGLYKATRGATHVVHFQCHESWHAKASLVTQQKAASAKHILVPNWHGLSPADRVLIPRYDLVVCPTRACKKAVTSVAPKDGTAWTHWDAGVPPVKRDGVVAEGRLKACMVCDAAVVDFCGQFVITLIREALASYPGLDLTVLSIKSWSRQDRRDLKYLEGQWAAGRRLAVRRAVRHADLTKEFHAHDWVVLPGVRADFGTAATLAAACGAAVVAPEVPPFDEVVTTAGLLVPCGVRRVGEFKAPVAVPALPDWLAAFDKAFSDSSLLLNLQRKDWLAAERQAAFDAAWVKLLER